VRADHVQAARRGRGRPLRRRRRVLRPAQGPGDHHRHHDRRPVAGPEHVAHTQHAGHEQLPAGQRLLHVQQADGDGGQAENAGDQHGTVQAGRQPGHVRHIQATAAGAPRLTHTPTHPHAHIMTSAQAQIPFFIYSCILIAQCTRRFLNTSFRNLYNNIINIYIYV